MCLLPGQNWEEGFCNGLVSSGNFVCLASRNAMRNPTNDRSNWEKLTEDSRCDNVLLEWRLALELKDRGMIDGIFPVFIGDKDASGVYGDYFKGCFPSSPDVVVAAVEEKVRAHLDSACLGLPYKDSCSVKDVTNSVFINQGGWIRGDLQQSVSTIITSVRDMTRNVRRPSQVSILPHEIELLRRSNLQLEATRSLQERELSKLHSKCESLEQEVGSMRRLLPGGQE